MDVSRTESPRSVEPLAGLHGHQPNRPGGRVRPWTSAGSLEIAGPIPARHGCSTCRPRLAAREALRSRARPRLRLRLLPGNRQGGSQRCMSCAGVTVCGGSITSSAKRPSILRQVFSLEFARPPGAARYSESRRRSRAPCLAAFSMRRSRSMMSRLVRATAAPSGCAAQVKPWEKGPYFVIERHESARTPITPWRMALLEMNAQRTRNLSSGHQATLLALVALSRS